MYEAKLEFSEGWGWGVVGQIPSVGLYGYFLEPHNALLKFWDEMICFLLCTSRWFVQQLRSYSYSCSKGEERENKGLRGRRHVPWVPSLYSICYCILNNVSTSVRWI